VDGKGTYSGLSEYKIVDTGILEFHSIYYRLMQFDFDGEFSEPKIISVDCSNLSDSGTFINIYPNPFSSDLNIVIGQTYSGKALVQAVNVLGQLVYSKEYPVDAGIQQLEVNLSHLAPAIYQVIIESGNKRIAEKIVKTR
jgi:hypothetical protein